MRTRRTGWIRRTWLLVCATLVSVTAVAVLQASSEGGEAEAAGTYQALPTPRRILETRPGLSTVDGQFEGIGARPKRSTLRLQVAGRAGVPNDAAAVVLNVTATGAATAGFAVVYPCGVARPNASSVNYPAAASIANSVIAKIGTGGDVCLYTNQRSHFVVDVSGSFPTGAYRALAAPQRLVDTRTTGRRPAGSTLGIQVAGRAGVSADAETVVLNLTSTGSTARGFALLYPCGTTRPNASTVNFVPGESIAAAAVVSVGSGGKVCLYSHTPSHYVVDVSGELPPATYVPLAAPRRLVETRETGSTYDWLYSNFGRRGAGTSLQLHVAGRAGVPDDASAVVLNVTAVEPVAAGFATVFPTGASRPNASTVNSRPGRAIANSAIAKVGVDGDVCLFTNQASHFVVDVAGYLFGPPPPDAGAACSSPLGQPRNSVRGEPDVAAHDGKLFVGAVSEQDKLYIRTRDNATNGWSGWTGLGHPPGAPDMESQVSAAVSDGRLFMFVSAGDHSRWPPSFDIAFRNRNAATNRWESWQWLRSPDGVPIISSFDTVSHDGRLFLLLEGGIPNEERIWLRTRSASANAWSSWTSLGIPPGTVHAGMPSLVTSGGKLFLFMVASDANLWFRVRDAATNQWSGWKRLGRPGTIPDLDSTTPPAVASADGRLFVFPARSLPGAPVSFRSRSSSSGQWTGWTSLGMPPDSYFWKYPTAVAADGRLFIVISSSPEAEQGRNASFKARDDATNQWGGWGDLGTFPNPASGPVGTAAVSHDGLLFVFGIDEHPATGRLRLRTRNDATNRWSDAWSSLGRPGPYQ